VRWLVRDVNAKLKRAEHHLGKLKTLTEGSGVANLVTTWTDRDRKGRVRVRVKEVREIPPEWHVRIGECVHDMRSALDHLAYGLNIIGSRQDPPPNHGQSAFPIYSDRITFRRGSSRGRKAEPLIRFFPWGARTAVESLQPYRGRKRDPITNQRLADLTELANIDKHRRFPITAVAPKTLPIPGLIEGYPCVAYSTWNRLLKPNATIIFFEVPGLPRSVKHPQVDFTFKATVALVGALGNPPIPLLVPHEPVVFTLESIMTVIRDRVLPAMGQFVPESSW
jgi:hypothetical protein